MILEEFDANQTAVINPTMIVPRFEGMPKVAVTCYSHVTLERLVAETKAEKIAETSDANMKIPVYETVYQGTKVALFMSAVGAAASVAVLEDFKALLEELHCEYTVGLMLEEARKRGLEKVMISCSTENEASERTILANGGVYEKTVSVEDEQIKRYWITL